MSTTITAVPKAKTVVVPEFTMTGLVPVVVPETEVVLEQIVGTDGPVRGLFTVLIRTSPTNLVNVGSIMREGTGWTARFDKAGRTARFVGDHFPTRTGKHTQVYALAFMVAIAAGFGESRATYGLRGEGVRA